NSSSSWEVSRASHTQYVPQVGLPHSAPVHSATKQNIAPVGASARAIMNDSRVLSTSPTADQKAMTRSTNIDIHAAGTWMKITRYTSPCWKSVGATKKPTYRPATASTAATAANHGAK